MKLMILVLAALVYQINCNYFEAPDCLDGWIHYNGHCYLFNNFTDVALAPEQYQGAEDLCVSLGGHLTSILDQAEQDFITQIIDDQGNPNGLFDWLIGMNDIASEGVFIWTDGEQVAFTNFDATTLNNPVFGCVTYNSDSNTWFNAPCVVNFNFICKRLVGRYTPIKPNPCTDIPGGDQLAAALCQEFNNEGTHSHPWADGWYIVCPTEPTPTCMPCPYWRGADGTEHMLVYNKFCDQCVAIGDEDSEDICYTTPSTTVSTDLCVGCPTTECDWNIDAEKFEKIDGKDTKYCQCVFKNYMCRPCPPGTIWDDENDCCL